jgi:hypothetical protein
VYCLSLQQVRCLEEIQQETRGSDDGSFGKAKSADQKVVLYPSSIACIDCDAQIRYRERISALEAQSGTVSVKQQTALVEDKENLKCQ